LTSPAALTELPERFLVVDAQQHESLAAIATTHRPTALECVIAETDLWHRHCSCACARRGDPAHARGAAARISQNAPHRG
jgi:hypothetical protein